VKLLLGIVGTLVLLFVAACIPHNLRIRRARAARRRMAPETRVRALELLAQAGRGAPATTMLVPSAAPVPSLVVGHGLSRLGGRALGREEVLPSVPSSDAKDVFLLQVELLQPDLPAVWRGRLVTVHLVDWQPEARSFAPGELGALRPLARPVEALPEQTLVHVPIPSGPASPARVRAGDDEPPPPHDPGRLLDAVSGLAPLLDGHGTKPADLLAQLLQPEGGGYAIDTPELVLAGGAPEYIQGEQVPECARCRAPTRFLFQFGDVFPGFQLADAGVGYVFGCDAHPERPEAWIDSH
jgi:hypothetical protein